MTAHPTDFYVAHRVYFGKPWPTGAWGALTDGPEDRQQVLDRIADWACDSGDTKPSIHALRVWHFTPDCPARDVTEDMLADALAQAERVAA